MPLSPKSEASLEIPEVKRRVARACQRCRLKKCKCDGAIPCTRCKSDDAICTYGKHKKSDKTIFRSGYVQMLERQHGQLIAGLQELYRRAQNGGGWTGPHLEVGKHNQVLTHEILQALGVLQPDAWEDLEKVNLQNHNWQGLEKQGQDEDHWIHLEYGWPSTQAARSQNPPTQVAFPQSEIMSKRRPNVQTSSAQTDLEPFIPTLPMPPPFMANPACIKPKPYSHACPTQILTPSDTLLPDEQISMSFDRASDSTTDWSFGMDDLFGNLSSQEQSGIGC